MMTPIGIEELTAVPPIAAPDAARTVARLTDPMKRRLIWFMQWASHQDGGLKKFAHDLLRFAPLGSPTMHRTGFKAETQFEGETFEEICDELSFYPNGKRDELPEESVSDCLDALMDEYDDDTPAARVRRFDRAVAREQRRAAILEALKPERRRACASVFLVECRMRALQLPSYLAQLCLYPHLEWSLDYMHDLRASLEVALKRQAELAKCLAAETTIATTVQGVIDFSHRTKSLVLITGPERVGKSKGAERSCFATPDRSRMVTLTAGTTDALFYGEIFDSLGCGEKKTGSAAELRSAIRNAVRNGDIALVFDEAHCLFGLSQRASIKRLEYIRTEFVNRGIPVVLIVTPQFADRLRELEEQTKFNVNQFRGRIARMVPIAKVEQPDIECVCNFMLPGVPKAMVDLLVRFGRQSVYPLAAVGNAITEVRELLVGAERPEINDALITQAISQALFTSEEIRKTLPAVGDGARRHRGQRGSQPPPAASLSRDHAPNAQGVSTALASDDRAPCIPGSAPASNVTPNRFTTALDTPPALAARLQAGSLSDDQIRVPARPAI